MPRNCTYQRPNRLGILMNERDEYLKQLKNDVWHILLHLYVHRAKTARLAPREASREELAEDIIALNSLADAVLLRIARLADRSKNVRSIKNFIKRFGCQLTDQSLELADQFHAYAAEVVDLRHNKLAHMKEGTLSEYPIEQLPKSAAESTSAVVNFISSINRKNPTYTLSVGSNERNIDLIRSLSSGETVYLEVYRC